MKQDFDPREKKDFFLRVYEVVKLIPKGRATSYGAIAKYLGLPRASRMVGWAMNASHKSSVEIPAHRVLNRNGMLTGKHHFKNENAMQNALEKEGIFIENDQAVNWEKIFWDPLQELEW
jgi:methylated-DNA-protein-cysteine methyltransferase-like protein